MYIYTNIIIYEKDDNYYYDYEILKKLSNSIENRLNKNLSYLTNVD